MANFCTNCGNSVGETDQFCSKCGTPLTESARNTYNTNTTTNNDSTVDKILGTLVTVNLINGLSRQLYYFNGAYYLDPFCRQPFMHHNLIMHRHRRPFGIMHRGGLHGGIHRGPHGGMHGGHGPHGGFGGPHGGHR